MNIIEDDLAQGRALYSVFEKDNVFSYGGESLREKWLPMLMKEVFEGLNLPDWQTNTVSLFSLGTRPK